MLCDIMYMHINWGCKYKEVSQDAIRKVKGNVECVGVWVLHVDPFTIMGTHLSLLLKNLQSFTHLIRFLVNT